VSNSEAFDRHVMGQSTCGHAACGKVLYEAWEQATVSFERREDSTLASGTICILCIVNTHQSGIPRPVLSLLFHVVKLLKGELCAITVTCLPKFVLPA